jgi:hypothetical protein
MRSNGGSRCSSAKRPVATSTIRFGPAYLLDAIGMTSRSIYAEPRVWKPLMERVVGDFIPAINKTYLQLNRLLAQRGSCRRSAPCFARAAIYGLPTMGASCRCSAGSSTTFIQAFRLGALSICPPRPPPAYHLAPLSSNPTEAADREGAAAAAKANGAFPQLNAMMVSGTLSSVMETLDHWQRNDPLDEYLRTNRANGLRSGHNAGEPYPVDPRGHCSKVAEESNRSIMDVVGFLFDYLFRDPSIPLRFRKLFEGLQLPFLKAALLDPAMFTDTKNPARRLLDELAGAAICAEDDEPYAEAYGKFAAKVVAAIRAEFVMDLDIFAYACEVLQKFSDQWQQRTAQTMQPQVDAGLAAETRDADRSRVRVLIRDKLSGINVPFDIRTFVGTVWADYMTSVRLAEGVTSNAMPHPQRSWTTCSGPSPRSVARDRKRGSP